MEFIYKLKTKPADDDGIIVEVECSTHEANENTVSLDILVHSVTSAILGSIQEGIIPNHEMYTLMFRGFRGAIAQHIEKSEKEVSKFKKNLGQILDNTSVIFSNTNDEDESDDSDEPDPIDN
jgi:2C-methyl-D-erythritol 2,4-cyclodiphosphate synthase